MKLITVKQLMKKSKTALIRKITKSLRSMPKKKLAMLCYEMTKSKLPRLRTTKQKALPKRKTKSYLYEVREWGRNTAKWDAAQDYCEKRGWLFDVWTEKTLKM